MEYIGFEAELSEGAKEYPFSNSVPSNEFLSNESGVLRIFLNDVGEDKFTGGHAHIGTYFSPPSSNQVYSTHNNRIQKVERDDIEEDSLFMIEHDAGPLYTTEGVNFVIEAKTFSSETVLLRYPGKEETDKISLPVGITDREKMRIAHELKELRRELG